MKRILSLILVFLLLIGILPAWAKSDAPEPMRAMLIRTQNNRDFPAVPGETPKEMKNQLTHMVEFADQNDINTLFFEVIPCADAFFLSKSYPSSRFWVEPGGKTPRFDPLKELIRLADKHSISVYAVINPYLAGDSQDSLPAQGPASLPENLLTLGQNFYLDPSRQEVQAAISDAAAELASRYHLSGIVFHQVDDPLLGGLAGYSEDFSSLVQMTKQKLPSTPLGVMASDTWELSPVLFSLAEEQSLDFLLPRMTQPVQGDGSACREALLPWSLAAQNASIPFYTQCDAVRLYIPSDASGDFSLAGELAAQWRLGQQLGSGGYLLDGYTALQDSFFDTAELLLAYQETPPAIQLEEIPTQLEVTRPVSSLSTTLSQYYLMGTSQPGVPVFLDGEEIPSDPVSGLFGALVSLSLGKNRFEIRQGEETKTVSITRTSPISTIRQILSPYPQDSALAFSGESLLLSCTAPAGGQVSASVAGQTISLSPVESASAGMPVRFEGSVQLTGGQPEETLSVGAVTYVLSYQGASSQIQSPGQVYLAGEGAVPSLVLTDYLTALYANPPVEGEFLCTVKEGMAAPILDQSQDYYQVPGGWIKKSAGELVEGVSSDFPAELSSFSCEKAGREESYRISSSLPIPVGTSFDGSRLILTFYCASGLPEPSLLEGSLFESVQTTQLEEDCFQMIFTLREGERLWGYQFSYEGNDLLLVCRAWPEDSSTHGKPLEGLSVMLDPGHGGSDPGALGVPGVTGPMESQLNLAAAQAVAFQLEQLGASVSFTHEEDASISLNDRMRAAEEANVDVFLSLHHNSTGENVDSSQVSGVEIYYHEPAFSASLAQILARNLSASTGRVNNGAWESYYRVTRMTFAPSVLVELGYLPNPQEYTQLCSSFSLQKQALAISESLVELLGRS